MRFDLRKVRDFPARLLCLYSIAITILVFIVTFNSLDDHGRCQSCLRVNSTIAAQQTRQESNESAEKCKTIHIAAICGGHDASRGFYVLLKSILCYRVNTRLELHLFVNNVSEKILRQLFDSWSVPDMGIKYYQTSDYEHEISWIPNQHYSNRYGLLKLVAPSVLADLGVERVLFLDTDMLVQGDITRLWDEFKQLDASPDSFIGLVENQSDWYLKEENPLHQNRIAWPALGRGFNTGLLLIDLVKLNRINWSALWRDDTEMELISHRTTVLADQDIYNSIIKRHRWIAVPLRCHYNLQLNDHTNLSSTCPNHLTRAEFKLIHWNSPHKLRTKNNQADYYRSWYTTFVDWNGMLLTRPGCSGTHSSDDRSIQPSSQLELLCKDIRPRPHEPLRLFSYFLNFETDLATSFDVTLVVHLSMDRIRTLGELAAHWAGPMSVAVYLSEMETSQFLEFVRASESLAVRKNIGYHLVFRDLGWNYPINRLRNIALDNAITRYAYIVDVDFLPSFNSYDHLKATLETMSRGEDQSAPPLHKKALVVPAFENNEYRFEYPTSKTELIRQLDLGTVTKFRQAIWPQGQSATDYARWRTATKPYEIEWAPEYEPFVVVERNKIRFDERFNGFGWNKVEYIMQLAASGYRFFVLPEVFSVHKSHPASYDIVKHRESRKYQGCIRMLKLTFLTELLKSHPDFKLKLTDQRHELDEKLSEIM